MDGSITKIKVELSEFEALFLFTVLFEQSANGEHQALADDLLSYLKDAVLDYFNQK